MTLRTPLIRRFGHYYLFNLAGSRTMPKRGAIVRFGIGYFRIHFQAFGLVLASRYKQWLI